MKLNNNVYDFLKWLTLIVLPAVATFYSGLGKLWSLPYVDQIPSTITLVSALLGTCMMISSASYNKDKED